MRPIVPALTPSSGAVERVACERVHPGHARAGQRRHAERADVAVQRLAAENAAAMAVGLPHALPRRVLDDPVLVAVDAPAGPGSHSVAVPLQPMDAPVLAERLKRFYGGTAGFVVEDHFDAADLSPHGYRRIAALVVMGRRAGLLEAYQPAELTIQAVDTPELLWHFEQILTEAFPTRPHAGGPVFDPAVLQHRAATLWIGSRRGEPVTASMSWVDGRSVGVYWVATRTRRRARGYGTAMTAAAVSAAPELPAVLTATRAGQGLYSRLGFEDHATASWWVIDRTR
jgi:hypothetical protein